MKTAALISSGVALAAARCTGRRTPFSTVLSVTNRCTRHCSYCSYADRAHRELSTDELTLLISQMAEAGVRRLNLFGGEPLLRDDIGRLVDHASSRGIFVSMVTNGALLPKRLTSLDRLDHLIVSLDGDEQAHDANRGAGSFDEAMAAIELARGRFPVWTITTLTRNNLGAIDFVVELARRKGFGATFQFLYHNEHFGKNHDALTPERSDCLAAVERLREYRRRGYPVVSSGMYLERLTKWPDFRRNILYEPFDGLRCAAGDYYCSVDTDGTVYPCSVLIGKVPGRHYRDGGFGKAFHGLERHSCTACLSSCMAEHSFLLSLSPARLWAYAKDVLPLVFRRGGACGGATQP